MSASVARKLEAEHGIVCRLRGEKLGYFGWPTLTRMDDGTLAVVSSGFRSEHVDPWGKTVLNVSVDDGATWSEPRVIQNSPIDDRDAGIVNLGNARLLVSWFTSDTRRHALPSPDPRVNATLESWRDTLKRWTNDMVRTWLGSWVMFSEDDGQTWGPPLRAPVTAPHGPIQLRSGDLLYLGKRFTSRAGEDWANNPIVACRSRDGGRVWEECGKVPVYPGTKPLHYCEPHVVELLSGRLLGMIRVETQADTGLAKRGIPSFSMVQTESDSGGRTWTTPKPLGFHGSPPHLLAHSSGVLVLSYGYRQAPYGQRTALSRDQGRSWEHDWILRDDGPDWDLGYPSTVELADGSLFTVYYQRAAPDKNWQLCAGAREKCSLLWSRWRLP